MAEIRKFSLVYDGEEDRIALDLEDVEGATTRLWLTQKLCRGLVGALAPMLEQRTAAVPAGRQAVQAFEQAAAMAEFGKTPGVTPTAGATTGLVKAVHVTSGDKGFGLTFEFGAGEQRLVGLEPPALRQTLGVLHRLHKTAGWPMEFWPSWVEARRETTAASAIN